MVCKLLNILVLRGFVLALRIALPVSCLLAVSGCFVKGDRSGCPCRLVLDFCGVLGGDFDGVFGGGPGGPDFDGKVRESGVEAELVITADNGFVLTESLDLTAVEKEKCVLIPRGRAVVGVWSGAGALSDEGGFEIPIGSDCPPVYFHASIIDADSELYRESVYMGKSHCVMTVNIKNMDPSPSGIGFMGNISGYGPDGRPLEGDFSYILDSPSLSGNRAILPRQLDDSLKMELVDAFGVSRVFALGEYIADSGYDWGAQDLEDIEIDLDIAMTRITLTFQGWDRTYSYEVVM